MADTAVDTISEIIGSAGGETEAKTLIPALEDLGAIIGAGGGGGGGGGGIVHYGTCSTSQHDQAKVVTCSNFSLEDGAILVATFENANSNTQPSLNVNSTGLKGIQFAGGLVASPLIWSANTTLTFVYSSDADKWIILEKSGVCTGSISTSESAQVKEVTLHRNSCIMSGTLLIVSTDSANTYSGGVLKLNVCGNTADVYMYGFSTSSYDQLLWEAGSVLMFIRGSSRWSLVSMLAAPEE